MGGNLIHTKFGLPKKRLSKKEYIDLVNLLIGRLSSEFPCDVFYDIPAYKSKQDFGDADIICSARPNLLVKFAKENADGGLFHQNSNVISFPYNGFQVDLISEPYEFHIAKTYFSYNDLGNLMGRIAHKFGLKYGHAGLLMPVRLELFEDLDNINDSHILAEIEVSKCPWEIFSILGFDYKRFLTGFETLTDIFEYVASSKYFNPDIYLLDNVNHKSRIRDKKRTTYMQFLDWIKKTKPETKFVFDKNKRKYYIGLALKYPKVSGRIQDVYKDYCIRKNISQKVNYKLINQRYPHLSIEEISVILKKVKQREKTELFLLDKDGVLAIIDEYANRDNKV